MKFKAGDKVRIKKDLLAEYPYGHYTFITKMEPYLGTIQIIQNINYFGDGYRLENLPCIWTDEMLEPLAIERLQKIPTYNTETNLWEVIVDGRKEVGNLEYVASEFIKDSLYYPFEYRENKPEGWTDHVHTFEEVIKYAIEHPNTFSVEHYKEYYSKQQLRFLNKLIQKLREVV